MSIARDGGSAFPNVDPHTYESSEGMTLRDWFAGQAMAGMWGNPAVHAYYAGDPYPEVIRTLAESAYEQADAMLEARERKEES